MDSTRICLAGVPLPLKKHIKAYKLLVASIIIECTTGGLIAMSALINTLYIGSIPRLVQYLHRNNVKIDGAIIIDDVKVNKDDIKYILKKIFKSDMPSFIDYINYLSFINNNYYFKVVKSKNALIAMSDLTSNKLFDLLLISNNMHFLDYKNYMIDIDRPSIAVTTVSRGAGKSAATYTIYKYIKSIVNKNLMILTYPEINYFKIKNKINNIDSIFDYYEIISSKYDLNDSVLIRDIDEIFPYLNDNLKIGIPINYYSIKNINEIYNSEVVLWGICKGSTEPPLIEPDLYIAIVDASLDDYIQYPGLFNLISADIIIINNYEKSNNPYKLAKLLNDIKYINSKADVIITRKVLYNIDLDTYILKEHSISPNSINLLYEKIKNIIKR